MSNPISASPNPTTAGQSVTLCYDFPEGVGSAVLELTWTPDGLSPAQISVSPDDPCETIGVPTNAKSLLVTGPDGHTLGVGIKP